MLRKLFSIAVVATLLFGTATNPAIAQKLDLTQDLPIDPTVTKGVLPNGLTYYIKSNPKPEQKVELRLVVKVGSLQENVDQQGLAHFMEHMNFNGLKHFPKNELVDYLQKIGVKFGADLNANTGFDRTYYILPIPTDNPDNLTKGFEIVSDWAQGALITDEEVNDERHVVSEELRMRDKNAGTRMMEQFLPKLTNYSRYGLRLPGGQDSIVLNASPDRIREFYHDWYRPNLQAVIVVGDITKEKALEMIKKYFGPLQNPKNERPRYIYDVKPYTEPMAQVVTDHEATNYSLNLLFPAQKRMTQTTLADYRTSLVRSIFTRTLNRKLREAAQVAKPPYTSAFASVTGSFGGLTLDNEGFELDVTPIGDFKTGIDSSVAELLRVQQYGFTDQDIENTKKDLLAAYENMYNERSKTLSADYVDEYADNFMNGDPIPGIVNEYNYVKEMLPTITAKDVSDLATKILSNSTNFYALITAPEKGDIDLPTEKGLLEMVKTAFQQKVSKPVEKKVATSLLTTQPKAGKIVSSTKDADLGTTTYKLSNGVLVTVKPTTFKDDEVVFEGVKFGGQGLFSVADKSNGNFMTQVIGAMGYGQFTPTELSDFLSGKNASVTTQMGQSSNVVSGSSSVKDLKTLFELNYLKLTEPRKDEGLFQSFIAKNEAQLKFIKANPQAAFVDTLIKAMYNNNPLAPIAIPSEKDFEAINPDRVIELYQQQFGNADGFHFFIVGNVDEATLKPLMEQYLASLPTKGTTPVYKDNGLRAVSGDKIFKFYKGNNNQSLILSQFHGDNIQYSDMEALKTDILGQVMGMQIIDTIREKMAVIYSGGANAQMVKTPYPHYTIMLQMPCGPENVDKILAELNREIKGYKTDGGPSVNLEKAKQAKLEEFKDNMKDNSYWADQLQDVMVWGMSKDFFLNYDKKVNSITQQDLINTAKELLGNNRFTAISYPEPDAESNTDKK